MPRIRKPDEPWDEQSFFAVADASNVAGLRQLLADATAQSGGLRLVWGKGNKLPRFILRLGGTSAGDLISGWAGGQVGVQVAALRKILGDEQQVLDELGAALETPGWAEAKEPTFDASLLAREDVVAAMKNLLASMAAVATPASRRCWALFADPDIYRIEDAVREIGIDDWATAGRPIKVGDRVLVWRGKGRSGRRGIVAFGEVVEGPRLMSDHENPYWLAPPSPNDVKQRVGVRYVVPPGLPLWLDEHAALLSDLSIARARGGTVFNVSADQWEALAAAAGGWSPPRARSGAPWSGAPYRGADEAQRGADCDPFSIDPDSVDRGNQGHARTQNALAKFLRRHGIEPRSPAPGEPEYDLAWKVDGMLFVAEVKSVTRVNEEKQLRLGLGQVLRYAHLLSEGGQTVTPVLVPERKPTDPTWATLCQSLRAVLVWPDGFGDLLGSLTTSERSRGRG